MNKFRILIAVIIIAFAGILVYVETVVENNHVVAENTTVEMWSTYTDKNGEPVTTTDASGNEVLSTKPKLVNSDYTELSETIQKEIKGKKIGDTATYEQDLSSMSSDKIDEKTMPYQYTLTINKVKINHDYEPEADESKNSDKESTDK